MDNTDRIKELLLQIHDAEQRLDGLRAELAWLVAEELSGSRQPVKGIHR